MRTTREASAGLRKLPPIPRKGNRTIYLADDELWEKAKALAGKDGLSSVISRALLDFVAQRSADETKYQRVTFEILGNRYSDDPTEVIGFEGKLLFQSTFDLVASPFEPDGKAGDTDIEIYRTRMGTIVLLARPVTNEAESASAFTLYEKHGSVRELMSGLVVPCMYPPARHELLNELTKSLGKDAVTWID